MKETRPNVVVEFEEDPWDNFALNLNVMFTPEQFLEMLSDLPQESYMSFIKAMVVRDPNFAASYAISVLLALDSKQRLEAIAPFCPQCGNLKDECICKEGK